MSGLVVVLVAWLLVSPALALLLGRAIRSNTRTHHHPARGPHTPAQARQTRSRR